MELRRALREQGPSFALQCAARDEIARRDEQLALLSNFIRQCAAVGGKFVSGAQLALAADEVLAACEALNPPPKKGPT